MMKTVEIKVVLTDAQACGELIRQAFAEQGYAPR
jgi:hypothetical protein